MSAFKASLLEDIRLESTKLRLEKDTLSNDCIELKTKVFLFRTFLMEGF